MSTAPNYRPLNIPFAVEKRLGITKQEYQARQDAGDKWCPGCKAWHSTTAFAVDAFRPDGLQVNCRAWFLAYQKRYRSKTRNRRL